MDPSRGGAVGGVAVECVAATVFVGLGSNLGIREANLQRGVESLKRLPGTEFLRCSRFVETKPVGFLQQPDFVNAVAEMATSLDPRDLLAHLKDIEKQLGRRPESRWGPRIIDLDILLYGREIIQSADLTVPHPELAHRAFVLEALLELAPELVHPVIGKPLAVILKALSDSLPAR